MKRLFVISALVLLLLVSVFAIRPELSVYQKPAGTSTATVTVSPAVPSAGTPEPTNTCIQNTPFVTTVGASPMATPMAAQTTKRLDIIHNIELPLVVARAPAEPHNPLPRNAAAKKTAYLTFDDGPVIHGRKPEINTANLLDILMAYHVKATFFMRGLNVITYPDLVKRVVAEGHTAGNHTWSHANPEKETGGAFAYEVKACSDAIEKITGIRPVVFRSPYGGGLSSYDIWVLNQNHLKPFGWNVETLDWAGVNDDFILTRVMNGIRTGKDLIILFHDHAWSAVDKTIELLIQNDYAFDTLDHKK